MKPIDYVYATLNHEETDIVPAMGFWVSVGDDPYVWETPVPWRLRGDYEKELVLFQLQHSNAQIVSFDPSGWHLLMKKGPFGTNESHVITTKFGGIHYVRNVPTAFFRKILYSPVKDPEDLDKLPEIDIEEFRPVIDDIIEIGKWFAERGYFCLYNGGLGPFEAASAFLRGWDHLEVARDILTRPDFAKRCMEIAMKPQNDIAKIVVEEGGAHGVIFASDIANAEGPWIRPEAFRKTAKVVKKECTDIFHKLKTPVFWHTHGNINPLLYDFVEAGIDCLNPIDPHERMDLKVVKEKIGDKMTLNPTIWGRQDMPGRSLSVDYLTKDQIKEHVINFFKIAAQGGGLILSDEDCIILVTGFRTRYRDLTENRKYAYDLVQEIRLNWKKYIQ